MRCLVLRGAGDQAFSSGFDIDAMEGDGPGGDRPDLATERAMEAVEAVPCPTVAFVNGAAFGAGCELAATCDLRIASQGAQLGMPPAKLGVVYAAAGLRRFLALVGPAHTREMFFTGRPVDAAKALAIGLVDRVAAPAEAEAAALALADEIARNAPIAVQGMKRILRLLVSRPRARPHRRGAGRGGGAPVARLRERRPARGAGRLGRAPAARVSRRVNQGRPARPARSAARALARQELADHARAVLLGQHHELVDRRGPAARDRSGGARPRGRR